MEYLIILISLVLVWATEQNRKDIEQERYSRSSWIALLSHQLSCLKPPRVDYSKINGKLEATARRAAIAEKFAERSFSLASSATLGVIALQKTLAVPKFITKPVAQRNQLAKNEIDKLFNEQAGFDYLRPILGDDEIELLDKIEEAKLKQMQNHNGA